MNRACGRLVVLIKDVGVKLLVLIDVVVVQPKGGHPIISKLTRNRAYIKALRLFISLLKAAASPRSLYEKNGQII